MPAGQIQHPAASDLGQNCLYRSVCPKIQCYNSIYRIFPYFIIKSTKNLPQISCYNGVLKKLISSSGISFRKFVCVEVLRPSQPNGVMSSVVSLPNQTFTGQA